jgi:hypothetical protein
MVSSSFTAHRLVHHALRARPIESGNGAGKLPLWYWTISVPPRRTNSSSLAGPGQFRARRVGANADDENVPRGKVAEVNSAR